MSNESVRGRPRPLCAGGRPVVVTAPVPAVPVAAVPERAVPERAAPARAMPERAVPERRCQKGLRRHGRCQKGRCQNGRRQNGRCQNGRCQNGLRQYGLAERECPKGFGCCERWEGDRRWPSAYWSPPAALERPLSPAVQPAHSASRLLRRLVQRLLRLVVRQAVPWPLRYSGFARRSAVPTVRGTRGGRVMASSIRARRVPGRLAPGEEFCQG